MEAKVIIVSVEKSNKSENNVWAVAITGEEQKQAYCKSAWKAMKFAFLLKKQTGFYIEDDSLHMLSAEIARQKAAAAAAEAEKQAEQEVQPEQQPEAEAEAKKEKKARKPRTKKVQAEPVLAQAAEAAGLIAFM
jgi:pyruvate/2-oxoglutarate dehydrogenase complex dihydrolipoamide acyltransferase (E2) component